MKKEGILKEIDTIENQLIEKYKPEKNGHQTIDHRRKTFEKTAMNYGRKKWINF